MAWRLQNLPSRCLVADDKRFFVISLAHLRQVYFESQLSMSVFAYFVVIVAFDIVVEGKVSLSAPSELAHFRDDQVLVCGKSDDPPSGLSRQCALSIRYDAASQDQYCDWTLGCAWMKMILSQTVHCSESPARSRRFSLFLQRHAQTERAAAPQ